MAVDYSNEATLVRAQAWLALPLDQKRYPAGLEELTAIYSLITGEQASTCRQCQYSDYVAVLKNFERHSLRLLHPKLMADSQYSLAPGFENETFVHEKFGTVLSADNLTDDGAEFFINNGFKHAFVKKEAAPAETETPAPKVKADYQAEYKKVLGTEPDPRLTIAELKDAIEARQPDQS